MTSVICLTPVYS